MLVFLELHMLVILGLLVLHIPKIGHPLFFSVNTQLIDLLLKFNVLFQHIFIMDSQSGVLLLSQELFGLLLLDALGQIVDLSLHFRRIDLDRFELRPELIILDFLSDQLLRLIMLHVCGLTRVLEGNVFLGLHLLLLSLN